MLAVGISQLSLIQKKSSSMTPPQFEITRFMTAQWKPSASRVGNWALSNRKFGLIGEPFVSVSTLLGYFQPTLVIHLLRLH